MPLSEPLARCPRGDKDGCGAAISTHFPRSPTPSLTLTLGHRAHYRSLELPSTRRWICRPYAQSHAIFLWGDTLSLPIADSVATPPPAVGSGGKGLLRCPPPPWPLLHVLHLGRGVVGGRSRIHVRGRATDDMIPQWVLAACSGLRLLGPRSSGSAAFGRDTLKVAP
jgi:hypothetical protein